MPPTVSLTLASLRKAGLGAFFRPIDVERIGISEPTLRRLVREGLVEKVGRGLYCLGDEATSANFTLAAVCARIPKGVLCLRTALQFHKIGSRMAPEVWLGIPHTMRTPTTDIAKLRIVRFRGRFLEAGVDHVRLDGVPANVTDVARTVIDCFRLSRLIDRETALEALRTVLQERRASPGQLLRMATTCGAAGPVRAALEVLGG